MSPADLDEATLTKTIEDIVVGLYQKAKYDDLTVKRVRARAETQLDLPQGILKTDDQWKAKSEQLIKDAAMQFSMVQTEYTPDAPSDNDNVRERAKAKANANGAAKSKTAQKDAKGVKRKAAAPAKKAKSQKRAKKIIESDEEVSDDAEHSASEIETTLRKKRSIGRSRKIVAEDTEDEDEEPAPVAHPETPQEAVSDGEMSELEDDTPPPKKKGAGHPKKAVSDSEMSELEDNTPPKKKAGRPKKAVSDSEMSELEDNTHPPKKKAGRQKKKAASDSEMSELEDDPPTKKARGRSKKTSSPSKPRARPGPKPKKASPTADSPSEAEIKRLQGWLNKCGMRRIWAKERKKYDTPQEYTQHLKNVLTNAGMTGRYSDEKAQQIKEQRELAQEMKAAQEYNSWWGQGEDAASIGRPRRAAARAAGTLKLETPKFSDDEEGEDEDEEEDENDDDDADVKMSDVEEDGNDDENDDGGKSESEGSAVVSDDFSD